MMNNSLVETLRKTLVSVLNMPDFVCMPIGVKYYVLKDVLRMTESQYYAAIEQELGVSETAGQKQNEEGRGDKDVTIMGESV